MSLVPVIHKCRLPGPWTRFRRHYRAGTVTSCPDCGITYYWSGWGWVPQDTIDGAKIDAIRGGDPIMELVGWWLLTPDQRLEVIAFKERWLSWEER